MSDLRIHAALSPRVAVLSSPDVDRVIQLNAIPDLPTLLRPFEFSVERLSVRTSQLETRICDRFPLRFDPYSLFNSDAARAIGSPQSQAAPRPSAVGQSHEELLDRVNHLIATNIKKWDAQVPRPVSTTSESQQQQQQQQQQQSKGHDDDDEQREDRTQQPLDDMLEKLRRGSLQEFAPWFDAVQQLVFGQRTIAKHESFGHPVAVLLAVSSASPDPMNDFAKLYEATSQASPFPGHPYINPDTLKYYVLIHDVRTSGTDLASSKEILEQVKKTYGLHCCMLTINSASDDRATPPAELTSLWAPYLPSMPTSPAPTSPTPGSTSSNVAALLDEEDVKRIKGFIRELTAQSIVPFMERYVQHMGDHLANSRKGLTNRLFGASRKLFGGVASGSSGDKSGGGASTPGGLATSGGYDPHHDFYPCTSIEAQTRRLADFAFTIRDYKLAASMYDLGRKDFASDKANRHTAGATEMFGLSHLMIMYTSRSAPIDVDSYLAQACCEYDLRSSARGSNPSVEDNLALRATLLYYEAYRMLGYMRPAPAGLLRMSQRSDEVLAPLLLEQAALACLQLRPKPSLRKFALYLVTAAHKYQACGQKILSLRCYAQAAVVYRQKGWALIENHIEHELGMQAYNEGDSDAAVSHLIKLIRPSANSSNEHERFLQDVQTAYKYSGQAGQGSGSSALGQGIKSLVLPFHIFDAAGAVLRFLPESSASATATVEDTVWDRLEEQLVEHGLNERTLPDGSKKRRKQPTSQTSTQARQVPVRQTFWLDVEVRNPLGVDLTIDRIRPVLKIDSSSVEGDPDATELGEDDFESEDAGQCALGPFQSRRIRVALRVNKEAKSLRIASIRFRLAETIDLSQPLDKKGPRLNKTKEHRTSIVYGPDLSLAISVHGPRPTLTAKILNSPQQIFVGEAVRLKVLLKNEGGVPIDDLRALCDQPEAAIFGGGKDAVGGQETMPNHLGAAVPRGVLDLEGHAKLEPGQEVEVDLMVRAVRTGDVSLAWLLPFSSEDGETYLSRLAFFTRAVPAVQVNVQTRPPPRTACLHEVTIEAQNLLDHDEVQLHSLSVLSPRWTLVSDSSEVGSVVIAPRQIWRGRVRIEQREGGQGGTEDEQYTATKLQDLLLSRDTRRPAPSDIKISLSTQEYASDGAHAGMGPLVLHTEARKVWRTKSLAAVYRTMAARDRRAAFTLWEPRDLDVVVQFSVNAQGDPPTARRKGQVAVYALQPGPLRSQIRAITHPPQAAAKGGAGQIRSLYAETIKEKASLLANILSSRISVDQCPVIVHVESSTSSQASVTEKYRFVVRNFSDRYTASVRIQLVDNTSAALAPGQGAAEAAVVQASSSGSSVWVGRKTLRCTLEAGGVAELVATRKGGVDAGGVRYVVDTQSFLGNGEGEGLGELVGRYVEHH
ncbi:hypothetical protein EX895_001149 [Sporisorium graminicola]|uniref:TPPC8 first Ig-like domain-containing protein n=1 Tax=Sporisorium graminicola TaxID=280036 RepID=A0A4U7L3B1_9BASI|nr:hypothetical protein EX895_001149 [Sporisorium graminicola]TKY89852.1 hypothetical protein EX895_001149 [Sporisorium graminicola]